MAPAPLRPLLLALDRPACRSLAPALLAFLAPEDLAAAAAAAEHSQQPHFLLELARTSHFMAEYLSRADRSLYFPFYGEQQYRSLERAQVAAIAQQSPSVFPRFHADYEAVFAQLRLALPDPEELAVLRGLLADPDLPLPRLKRETQGMFCSSPFQLFLVDCTFRPEEEEPACFEQLREFLSLEREEQYLKQFIGLLKERGAGGGLRRVMKLRYTPYEVSRANMGDFLLEGCELHNFLVGLFALTDVLVESTHALLARIPDPLHRLAELLLRYALFRNYVLAVEDYLAFAFRTYHNIYHDAIEQDPKKPQYSFWRPALTKWFLRMSALHEEGTAVYLHCLTKLRLRRSCEQLRELSQLDQPRYGKLLSRAELNPFPHRLAQRTFDGLTDPSGELAHYFDAHPEHYELLVMEFNEYLIDLSVNEQTVHWCGHSQQQLEQPYLAYEEQLVRLSAEYLPSLVGEDAGGEERAALVRTDLEYLSLLQVKNRTLKRIVALANADPALCAAHPLLFDFDEADRKLEYFNEKALILAQVGQHERPFYSIPPLCSAERLIEMLDTNDSSSNESEGDNYEYHSDCEEGPFPHEEPEDAPPLPLPLPAQKPAPLKKVFAEDYGESAGEQPR